jgi:hypothetical protein
MKTLNFILLLAALLSCGDDNFRKVEKLNGFRVLGIKADKPEITNGLAAQNIDLELIVSDVNGGGRIVSGEVVSCIDPGVGYGAEVSCDHDPLANTDPYVINFSALPNPGSVNHFTGIATYTFDIPGNFFSFQSARDQFNGVAYLTIFTFEVDGETHKVFKRIVVTNRTSLNSNPLSSNIQKNGIDINAFPQNGDELSIMANSPETYTYRTVEDIDETRTEELQVAWYVSDGELSRSKTYVGEKTEYDKSEPTSSSSVVVAIVRDERGGLDYKIFSP